MRYFVERPRAGGRAYYWVPTAKLIAAGFQITRLPGDKAAAVAQAEALNAELDRWYRGEPIGPQGPRAWSLAALSDLFQADHTFRQLADRTQRDFSYAIRPALAWAGGELVADITRKAVMAFLRDQIASKGAANARNTGAALRRLLAFGRDQGWIETNPASETKLPTPASRARVWTVAERDAFMAAATSHGRPSMALAVILGWCLGQRPADLRTLAWTAYDGRAVTLRQAKTGTPVVVPALPELRRALDATQRTAIQIVVSETTGRPYQESAFQHLFAEIREKAGLATDLQYRDLRRTLATALGAAGCTDDQIRAITGHKTRAVVSVYVRPDPTYGEAAMKRLQGAQRRKS